MINKVAVHVEVHVAAIQLWPQHAQLHLRTVFTKFGLRTATAGPA